MVDLCKVVWGQMCIVRISGYCNYNFEIFVLVYYRLVGMCGIVIKLYDMQVVIVCSLCYDLIDGWVKISDYIKEELCLMYVEGVFCI